LYDLDPDPYSDRHLNFFLDPDPKKADPKHGQLHTFSKQETKHCDKGLNIGPKNKQKSNSGEADRQAVVEGLWAPGEEIFGEEEAEAALLQAHQATLQGGGVQG
jgi:hypothetical protein